MTTDDQPTVPGRKVVPATRVEFNLHDKDRVVDPNLEIDAEQSHDKNNVLGHDTTSLLWVSSLDTIPIHTDETSMWK